ncbi:MAG: type secretion system protein GspE [Firmicutes bacterium]|nr:type secretion system protein GspE [Bacillota bacterium]
MLQYRKALCDLLRESGLLNQSQLDKALAFQQAKGGQIGEILINLGYITEEDIIRVLERQSGVSYVDLSNIHIDKKIAAILPVTLVEKHKIVPIKKEEGKITIAMLDPTNFFAIDDVRLLTGCAVEAVIASELDLMRAINKLYGLDELVEKAVNKLRPEDTTVLVSQIQMADDAPIISIVNSLFTQAVREGASDIHLEPQAKVLRVRFRIDGILREVVAFTRDIHAAIVSRIKVMGNMDIAEKRLPQDGRINIIEQGREIDIRVSTLPTILGEKAVLRILDKAAVILDINKLGFSAGNLERYRRLYSQSYGMILVTGPTGSGKSTTLYSTLSEINTIGRNTITIEDPVEYRLEGANQVQVNPKAGLTFASGLRSILRQDPNIVMVGEIRDGETADIAIRAALTGHLVLSTLHTNDAAGALTRLIDMGIEHFLVSSAVLGVIAQRLVRAICPRCKRRYIPEADSLERLYIGIARDLPIELYKGVGCAQCGFTGYRGRMGIHEVMPISPCIREMISRQATTDEITLRASKEGMVSMKEDGIQKALAGMTTIEEVMRVAYICGSSLAGEG